MLNQSHNMKFDNFFIFLILLVIVIFAIGCTQTQKPSSSPQQSQQSASGSTALPAWVSGQAAQLQLTVPNGKPPYKCSLKPGSSLPEGFNLANNCVLSGTRILAPGSSKSVLPPFSVIITDSSNPPLTSEVPITITIVESGPSLIPESTGVCTVNEKCKVAVANADGGTFPYYFKLGTLREGAPPMGMIVDQEGYLTGTPSKTGIYNFEVCVVDQVGASDCQITSVKVKEEGEEGGVSLTIDSAECKLINKKLDQVPGAPAPWLVEYYYELYVSGTVSGPIGTILDFSVSAPQSDCVQFVNGVSNNKVCAPFVLDTQENRKITSSWSPTDYSSGLERKNSDSPKTNWQVRWTDVKQIKNLVRNGGYYSESELSFEDILGITAKADGFVQLIEPNKEYSEEESNYLFQKEQQLSHAAKDITVKCTKQ